MRYVIGIFLALTLACSTSGDPEPEHWFATRPVNIQVSSLMRAECETNITRAVHFWYLRGTSATLEWVDPGVPSQLGIPVAGVVALVPGRPSMRAGEVTHGETRLSLTLLRDIYAAEVTLASCDERVVAHELGHALGLVDVADDDNLMNGELEAGGWELTDAQLLWVQDSLPFDSGS